MSVCRTGLLALGLAALAACSSGPAAEVPPEPELVPAPAGAEAAMNFDSPVEVGELIADSHCARCHAVGRTGDSPHPDAKPFRRLSENYPVGDLAESFAEGIIVGHPDMPMFVLGPHEIDALIAYLESIQDPHPI